MRITKLSNDEEYEGTQYKIKRINKRLTTVYLCLLLVSIYLLQHDTFQHYMGDILLNISVPFHPNSCLCSSSIVAKDIVVVMVQQHWKAWWAVDKPKGVIWITLIPGRIRHLCVKQCTGVNCITIDRMWFHLRQCCVSLIHPCLNVDMPQMMWLFYF